MTNMSSELRRTTEVSFFGGRWSHARGTIRSLRNRKDKWLAFVLNIQGGNGPIDFRTFLKDFSLEYADHCGTFRAGSTVVGTINTRGEVRDQSERLVGYIHDHPARTPMGRTYNNVLEIGVNSIAAISYLSDLGDRLWKAPALVQNVSEDISSHDAEWILAVIAMKLYLHCRTTRLT